MKKLFTFFSVLALISSCTDTASGPRLVQDFNFDWKFTLNEDSDSFREADFDDAFWRSLRLPHDWSVESDFIPDAPCGANGGCLPGGLGWYRKHFATPEGDRTYIEFDGVYQHSTVYVNGKEVGFRPYGYSSFSYDLSSFLNPVGEDNVIAVRVDNSKQPNSRWYSGSGIFRNVRLVSVNDVHVAYCGTYVTTPEISADAATFAIETTVEKSTEGDCNCAIAHVVKDASGKTVGKVSADMQLTSGENVNEAAVTIAGPHLWDIDDCYLYTIQTSVSVDGKVVDEYETTSGIRNIGWTADKGFFLNGRPVKLLGVCLHHDMGCLGTAVHYRALERELGILKEMGVNAIRTSHNPPAPELLEIADNMGFLIMDEAFDMWRKSKTPYDYSNYFEEWHVRDLQGFVKRDRNHPSIIMWSVANEILEQDGDGNNFGDYSPEEINFLINFMKPDEAADMEKAKANRVLARHMVQTVKDLDSTRYVTAGNNSFHKENNLLASGAMDIMGVNYQIHTYDDAQEWFPGAFVVASETASCLQTRGWYPQPAMAKGGMTDPDNWQSYATQDGSWYCTAYDNITPGWGATHEEAWIPIRDRDYIAGTFIWTGFDYIGEPTPFYRWPARSSYFGIVDLAGFPKDSYWMYMSEWTDKTTLHVFPHWNWNEGDKVDIWCYYNNADEVELFVNGNSQGTRSKTKDVLHAEWPEVAFEPGKIEVVSYKDGKEVARETRETAGEPVSLRLTADRTELKADGYDLSYVTVEALDAEGRAVPTANVPLHFEVSGAGELVGVDNGDQTDHASLKGSDKPLFAGKALGVVRSMKDSKGKATLTVTSPIGNAELSVSCE